MRLLYFLVLYFPFFFFLYNSCFFAEIFPFPFVSEHVHDGCFNVLVRSFDLWFILVLASLDGLFIQFEVSGSWYDKGSSVVFWVF